MSGAQNRSVLSRETLMLDGLLCLHQAPLKLCVDAAMGGHIVEFSFDGDNALITNAPEVGSTFWPSPQHAWGWPPPKTLDKAPYKVVKSKDHIEIVSDVCEVTGLQLSKSFHLESGRLLIEYEMRNPGDSPLQFAPWEITRIGGGLTFYQSTERPLALSTGTSVEVDGVVWHDYRPEMQEQNEKVFGNGSVGWLANAYQGLLFIKQFEPVNVEAVAQGEAEIEIYGHGDPQNAYVEVEQQGRYQVIPPLEKIKWQVQWLLAPIPEKIDSKVGSNKLVKLVKSMVNDSPFNVSGKP